MLYHLFQWLKNIVDIPGGGLLDYLSFRAIMASVTALAVSIFAGKAIIRLLQRGQIGEEIRDLGLEGQMQKKGTPTMGGIIIILAILSGALLFADLTNIYVILLIVTTIGLGTLGFVDDYIKVFRHNKDGLSERRKLIGQISLALIIGLTVCFSPKIVVRVEATETSEKAFDAQGIKETTFETVGDETVMVDVIKCTRTTIPFIKSHEFDYKWLSPFKGKAGWYCKWAIYLLMIIFIITACTNSTNFADGMDGLASGTCAIIGVVLGIFAWLSGNIINADYLNIMYIPGAGEIFVFMAAFAGALVGFLWYNSYPAQVFMGDTGSLAVGGIIGVAAILTRKELLLPLAGGVIFVEGLSVLLQRYYFKYTRRKYGEGRRILKMAPLHHHFQKENIPALIQKPVKAIPESKIVIRFWISALILAVLSIGLLKLR